MHYWSCASSHKPRASFFLYVLDKFLPTFNTEISKVADFHLNTHFLCFIDHTLFSLVSRVIFPPGDVTALARSCLLLAVWVGRACCFGSKCVLRLCWKDAGVNQTDCQHFYMTAHKTRLWLIISSSQEVQSASKRVERTLQSRENPRFDSWDWQQRWHHVSVLDLSSCSLVFPG